MKPEISKKIEKLYKTLAIGTPVKTALKYCSIPYVDYCYWLMLYNLVEYMNQQEESEKLEGEDLSDILEQAREMARAEKGQEVEPPPEAVVRYNRSERYRKNAIEIHDIIEKCRVSQTSAVVRHLSRIATSEDKAQLTASQWFLERALPEEFGLKQSLTLDKRTSLAPKPIKVEFVKSDSEADLKRVAEIEKELLGSNKRA